MFKQVRNAARGSIPYGVAAYNYVKGLSKTSRDPHGRRFMSKTSSYRRSRATKRSFHAQLVNDLPAKHDNGEQAITVLHNQINTLNLTGRIVQGTSNTNRVGDAIDLAALKISGFFNTSPAAGAYAYRVIIGYSGEEYSASTFTTSGLVAAEIFLPNTSTTYVTNGLINSRAFTTLYDQKFVVNSLIATVADREDFNFTVPLSNSRFSYQAAASTYGKFKNLYMIVLCDVVNGTSGVTANGGFTLSWDTIFKG